jgi:hypothetical protein
MIRDQERFVEIFASCISESAPHIRKCTAYLRVGIVIFTTQFAGFRGLYGPVSKENKNEE